MYLDGDTTEPDGHLPRLTHNTSLTFAEKSAAEKDELLERIALQLAEIGDMYIIEPLNASTSVSILKNKRKWPWR